MNIPEYLQPYFNIIKEKKGDNYYITGDLTCCENKGFYVNYSGDLRQNIWKNKHFDSGKKRMILTAKCCCCSREIHIFDDAVDGYDNCIDKRNIKEKHNFFSPLTCHKCNQNIYKIKVSYEYSSFEDLIDLNIQDRNNSFTWVKISLTCITCNKIYNNIVDSEMG